ncbi:MAG: LOG family protein [Anaerolineae bacterium]
MADDQRIIAVFGSSRREPDGPLYRQAYELGVVLARAGYTVLSGGYGGSMAAVSRGAAEAGGRVIGVTCAIFDPLPPNPWLTEEIKAPTLIDRLSIMLNRAGGFVAVRGGIGTLSEVTLAWSLLQTRSLNGKPLVLLGTDWQPLLDAFLAYTDLGRSIAALARIVTSPADVLPALAAPPIPPGPPPLG